MSKFILPVSVQLRYELRSSDLTIHCLCHHTGGSQLRVEVVGEVAKPYMLKNCPSLLGNQMFHYIMLRCKGFEGKEQMLLSWYATKPNIELDNG